MSLTKNSDFNYSAITKIFHWAMALLIIGMLVLGNVMEGLSGMDKLKAFGIHKSTGILILFLVFLRFGWRQFTYQPPVPESDKLPRRAYKLIELAAKTSHVLIYFLMFAMPLSGWMLSSGVGFPVSVYGLFTMPNLISPDKQIAGFLEDAHGIMSNILIAILLAHVGGALFHHFYLKDIVMKRMLPVLAVILLPAISDAAVLEVDKSKSSIAFEAIQNNAPVKGEFKNYTAFIDFDPARLESSKAVIEIDISSLSAPYGDMVETLKTSEWLDVKKFPGAKFEVVEFSRVDKDNYLAKGKLTIRDITAPVTLAFTLSRFNADGAIIEGEAVISRTKFKVGQGEWADTSLVKDGVKVMVHIEAGVK